MFYFGLDLGKMRDPSALVIVEREVIEQPLDRVYWREERKPGALVVRHLERMKLGTPYLEVAKRAAAVARHPAFRVGGGIARMLADATGVGLPVVEMVQEQKPGCEVTAVIITGSGLDHSDGRVTYIPKLQLMARLRQLLEKKELRISRHIAAAGALVKELLDVQGQMKETGRVRVGADGCGQHDDLAIALALACWEASKPISTVEVPGGRLFW